MRIRCHIIGPGPGPSEKIVEIATSSGKEEVVVDDGFVNDGQLTIRRVVERHNDEALVELPQESSTGRWRLWVKESALAGC